MGGSGERREQKFEGRSKNSKQDLGGRRSETETKRRRAIVYRASGRPSRVEVYMQAGGLPLEEGSRFGVKWACELATAADAYPTQ